MHDDLRSLYERLKAICASISDFQPPPARPPILDSSLDLDDENHWLHPDNIPGLKKLREAVTMDLEALEKFLQDPRSEHLPPLSTNAPYLVSVWNELLCAPSPVISVFRSFNTVEASTAGDTRKRGAPKNPAVKVDIEADNGRRWIRINTVKNARLLSEFREIDSYYTSSDDDDDERPSLAQKELDNSILRMGRALLTAAKANPVEGISEPPRVTLRLTRLDPSSEDNNDPRIAETVEALQLMGIDVEFGERPDIALPKHQQLKEQILHPTPRMNLDLSVLIALVSDLTHAPLPSSVDEASKRFIPAQSYRAWKQERNKATKGSKQAENPPSLPDDSCAPDDMPAGLAQHSRALSNQLLQEMSKGLIQEIRDQLAALPANEPALPAIEFWTTPEARDRCIRIIAKIGGVNEKRRAHALFPDSGLTSDDTNTLEKAEEVYWRGSRYSRAYIPLLPIRILPSATPPNGAWTDTRLTRPPSTEQPPFFRALSRTCAYILAQETVPHPRALAVPAPAPAGEIPRAAVTRLNPRLTAHTVESLLWGAELGWTTLTANKTSVKAVLREMRAAKARGELDGGGIRRPEDNVGGADGGGGGESDKAAIWVVSSEDIAGDRELVVAREQEKNQTRAAIWVVDPRSLAEGMRSDYAL